MTAYCIFIPPHPIAVCRSQEHKRIAVSRPRYLCLRQVSTSLCPYCIIFCGFNRALQSDSVALPHKLMKIFLAWRLAHFVYNRSKMIHPTTTHDHDTSKVHSSFERRASSSSCSSARVCFASVEVRSYPRILGDNPSVSVAEAYHFADSLLTLFITYTD